LGTVTMDPEVYKTYIESKKPKEIEEDEAATVEKMEQKGWTGFHSDEEGLFIYDYMIKGFLKNAGNVLKDLVAGDGALAAYDDDEAKEASKAAKKQSKKKSPGIKALRSKIDNYVFVTPRRIHLGKEKADDVVERPLRAMTAKGPRVTLARSDSIEAGTVIEFEITLIKHKEISWKVLDELFEYGQLMGLGQFRNGGYGRFKVL